MTDRLHDQAEDIAVPEGPIESNPPTVPDDVGPGDPRVDRDPDDTPPADEISHPG
jgi:hypothetical protein